MSLKLFAKPVGCLILWAALAQTPAFADANYDQGLRLFQAKNYAAAAKAFEKSIENAPWESSSYYYCALSYHYGKDFKKAGEKYGAVIEKFPGTQAANQALSAIKVVAPNFFKDKQAVLATATAAAAKSAGGTAASGKKDMGTVEGEAQTRVYFSKSENRMIADVRVGGRGIKANINPNAAETGFSRSQLQALGVQVPAGAKEVRTEIQLGGVIRKNFPVTVDDSVGTEPQLGQSFLEAFLYQVDEKANCISLTRKGGTGGGAATASGPQLSFTKDGKDIIVNVEVNGRGAQMIFDPNGEGLVMPPRVAKSVGLKVDEAEEQFKSPAEGPQRGEPGWVPPEERQSGPKYLTVNRVKFGPGERAGVNVQITEKESKYGKVGPDMCPGYKYDIDYQANVIRFTRK